MSYIRATCNPESLYVLGTVNNEHDFYWTDRKGNPQKLFIPSDDFDEFFKRLRVWEYKEDHDLWDEVFEYKGISLQTVTFHEGLKRILTDKEIEERDKIHMFDQEGKTNRLICLTYKDSPPLLMWVVTWDRLRDSAYYHLFWPNKFVLKMMKWFAPKWYSVTLGI